MPLIQIELDETADALIDALAKQERRSKREQVAYSAIAHARSLLPHFRMTPTPTPGARRGSRGSRSQKEVGA